MVRLRIALLPDSEVTKYAIQLSRRVGKEADTYFILDGIRVYPHITLIRAEFADKDASHIRLALKELVKDQKPFRVRMAGLSVENGFLQWNCSRNNRLGKLRSKVRRCLKSFALGDLSKGNYEPHLTLTEFKSKYGLGKILSTTSIRRGSFTAKHIALCETTKHGIVIKIVARFRLRG